MPLSGFEKADSPANALADRRRPDSRKIWWLNSVFMGLPQ
jgi:hypothetical protein